MQCSVPCSKKVWSSDSVVVTIDKERFLAKEPLPRCIECGAIARPNILMFGDFSWIDWPQQKQHERFRAFLQKAKNLTIIEIGAGTAVPTVRMVGESIAKQLDAKLIRINPRDIEAPKGTIVLQMGAKEAIEKIGKFLE